MKSAPTVFLLPYDTIIFVHYDFLLHRKKALLGLQWPIYFNTQTADRRFFFLIPFRKYQYWPTLVRSNPVQTRNVLNKVSHI